MRPAGTEEPASRLDDDGELKAQLAAQVAKCPTPSRPPIAQTLPSLRPLLSGQPVAHVRVRSLKTSNPSAAEPLGIVYAGNLVQMSYFSS